MRAFCSQDQERKIGRYMGIFFARYIKFFDKFSNFEESRDLIKTINSMSIQKFNFSIFIGFLTRELQKIESNPAIQCRFKSTGQKQQNSNFQRHFSQIGLRLNKNEERKSCLEFHHNYYGTIVSEILNQNFTPKMGHFGFFQKITKITLIFLALCWAV